MTQNEKIVLDNLLERISKDSYPAIEKMFNRKIEELNEEHIGVLLVIFNNEINNGKIASQELITEILEYTDYANDNQIEYSLMQLEINNYNIRELETFVNNQIELLNKPLLDPPKSKNKSKKNLYK